MFWAEILKISDFFLPENFQLLEVQFSVYLNRCVFVMNMVIWAARCESVSSGICGQRRLRSACASGQSDQGLRSPQTKSLDIKEGISEEQMP